MLAGIPITDNSESRYAEMARHMAAGGSWITPEIAPGVPFWAKPPLAMWLSGASMRIFGQNEFAARLPIFALACATLALLWWWLKERRGSDFALVAVFILGTSALFTVVSGTVMTDLPMMAATSLAMVSFWNALPSARSTRPLRWAWVFFGSLGLAMLAKGPAAVVLALLPIGTWTVGSRRTADVWRSLPWIRGALLALAIAAPWYTAAEISTPGFLRYFIVGEHISRFLVPGWKGDLYGSAHDEPPGTIWFFALAGFLPWTLMLPTALRTWTKRGPAAESAEEKAQPGWLVYLACWALVPLVFFTFSRNIISTYPVTALPAAAILLTEAWASRVGRRPAAGWLAAGGAAAVTMLGGTWFCFAVLPDLAPKPSQKRLASFVHSRPDLADHTLNYRSSPRHSIRFYTGDAVHFLEAAELGNLVTNGRPDLLVLRKRSSAKLPNFLAGRFHPLATFGDFVLFAETPPSSAPSHENPY